MRTKLARLRIDNLKFLLDAKSEDVVFICLCNAQTLVGFIHDLIDDRFHVVRALEHGELSIRARAFTHDPFDVRHFFSAAQFINFSRNEFEQFI